MRACHPLPNPPPQAGEGADPVCRAVIWPKAEPSLAESSAIIGQKPHSPLAKAAFVTGQTAHRFAAGNLLRQRRASALDCVFVRRINRLQPSARYGEGNARMDASPAPPSSEEPSNPLPPDVPASPPPEAPPRRGVSWLGIAVAGIGVILAVLGVVSLLLSRDNGVSALDARLAGVELDLRDLAPRAPPPAAAPKALDAVAAREARVRADAGAAEISELAQKPPGAVNRSEFEALANRTAAVERSEKAAQSAAASTDRAMRLALAATALNAAVDRGDAFAAE